MCHSNQSIWNCSGCCYIWVIVRFINWSLWNIFMWYLRLLLNMDIRSRRSYTVLGTDYQLRLRLHSASNVDRWMSQKQNRKKWNANNIVISSQAHSMLTGAGSFYLLDIRRTDWWQQLWRQHGSVVIAWPGSAPVRPMYHTAIHRRTIVAHYSFREQGNGNERWREKNKKNKTKHIHY